MHRIFQKIPRVLVIGDLMLDYYLLGECNRISPEAPVQVVDVKKENIVLGGAGNVISNLKALGGDVGVISVVGSDLDGSNIQKELNDKNVRIECIIESKDRKTTRKTRVISAHQQVIRFDFESKSSISFDEEKRLLEVFINCVNDYDIVLLSDYGKGVLTHALTKQIIANVSNQMVLVDPKGNDYSKYKGATLLTPNKKELAEAYGQPIESVEALKRAGWSIKHNFAIECLLVTLSEEGMMLFEEKETKIPTIAKEVFDVTGAGDTVLAAMGFGLASGLSFKEAALFATSAAAVVVGKLGSATATLDEISAYEKYGLKKNITKILDKKTLKKHLDLHVKGKVVFTNGCFDLLHAGHVSYLEKAKALGEVLVVGLNSDESVKRLKGPSRPINCVSDRAKVLAGLEAVDYIVVFEEDTPEALVAYLQPDILAKGADYIGKDVAGKDYVKEVVFIDFLDGRSTTEIIKKAQL